MAQEPGGEKSEEENTLTPPLGRLGHIQRPQRWLSFKQLQEQLEKPEGRGKACQHDGPEKERGV